MASTYTANLKIELITPGEQSGAWGATTNNNFTNSIEQAIVGQASVSFPSNADLTLTLTDQPASVAQNARSFFLAVTSAVSLTTTRTLTLPAINKTYLISNGTTGSQAISVARTGGGTTVTVPNGARVLVYAGSTGVAPQVTHVPALTVGSTAAATETVATTGSTQTLTNKTISGSSNALSNISNASLTNSSMTLNGQVVPLGGTATISTASASTLTIGTGLTGGSYNGGSPVTIAIDSTVATLTGSQTLTNKTLTAPVISSISNSGTVTIPTGTSTLVTTTGTQTLTNKTISGGSISGITDLAVADGGTGASTAAAARTNLGFASGTYTPTVLSSTGGISSITSLAGQYAQIGDIVTVSGSAVISTSSSASHFMSLSIPVSSNFTVLADCMGAVGCGSSIVVVGVVGANPPGARMGITFYTSSPITSVFVSWSATYVVK